MGLTLVIATPVEAELVERIRAQVPDVDVSFEPDLLPPPRYPSDHAGDPSFERSQDDEERFRSILARADVTLGVPGDRPEGLRQLVQLAPGLQWVQGTAAGAGQLVHAAGLDREDLDRIAFTSSVGVHASQLAEWAILGLLYFTKQVPRLHSDARERRWPHYPARELRGQRLLVVGLGHIGREVARSARALGMHVSGVRRRPRESDLEYVDELVAMEDLAEAVTRADSVVLALPGTPATKGLFTAELVDAIPDGGILVNVGRGNTLDEAALTAALAAGRLTGAALDVFETEPLPDASPLWEMDNVLVSPHTAALSTRENERIVDLLVENLRRFQQGRPLLNVVDVEQFY